MINTEVIYQIGWITLILMFSILQIWFGIYFGILDGPFWKKLCNIIYGNNVQGSRRTET